MSTKNETKIIAEPGKQELFVTREFDAPRELVFRAFTELELIEKWLGPRDLEMKVERYDARHGGTYRYINTDKNHNVFKFHGVIHEVSAPELLIQTFEYEGLPEKGHVSLETTRFEALASGKTRLTMQAVFQSAADRDGMIQAGMEHGVREGYERLDELLAKM